MNFKDKLFYILKNINRLSKNETANLGKFKYKYVTLDKLQEELRPLLIEYKLICTHYISNSISRFANNSDYIVTKISDTQSEEYIDSMFRLPQDLPQEIGKSITYGKRYNLGCLFDIIIDDDNDANGARDLVKEANAIFSTCRECGGQMKETIGRDGYNYLVCEKNKTHFIKL